MKFLSAIALGGEEKSRFLREAQAYGRRLLRR